MNTVTAAPLVFLHLLADRRGLPAALLFDMAAARESEAAPSLDEATLCALSNKFPCFYDAKLTSAPAAALQAGGWRALDAASLQRCDSSFELLLEPATEWVRGDWCLAPPVKAPGNQVASRALALQLVQLVAADGDTHEIEDLLRRDPTLSYHLLRLVNSLGVGQGRRITSFSQAILILGRQQLRRWLNLMLFAAREGDVRTGMLLARVAVRSCAMEALAKASGLDKPTQEQAFMCGMFSLLGALFGMPLAEVLQPLKIGEAVLAALLSHEGELGALLALLETAEGGRFSALGAQLQSLQLRPEEFNDIVLKANLWMLGVLNEGAGNAHV